MILLLNRCLVLLKVIFLLSCSNEPTKIKYDSVDPNFDKEVVSIASLREDCSRTVREITGEVYIEGVVLSRDDNENIRNSLYITDHTATLELKIDEKKLYSLFPCGSKIRVLCNSLYMQISDGIMRIGYYKDRFTVDNIPNDKLTIYLERYDSHLPIDIISYDVSLSELNSDLLGNNISIDGVQFVEYEPGLCWIDREVATTRVLVDMLDSTLNVATSLTATFANYELPIGSGAIGGTLVSRDGVYELVVTNYNTVHMKLERF